MKITAVIDSLIQAKCTTVQVGLRGAPGPLGPGTVEKFDPRTDEERASAHPDLANTNLYVVKTQAHLQVPSAIPGMQPTATPVLMPMIFSGDDVLWVSGGPTDMEGKLLVVEPGNGRPAAPQRPRGGLTI